MSYLLKLLEGFEIEWIPLAHKENGLAELSRGRVMSKEYLAENAGKHPVYSSQTANNGEIGRINTFDYDGEFITWTTDGANAGTVFHRTGKFSITNVFIPSLHDIHKNFSGNIKFRRGSKFLGSYTCLFYPLLQFCNVTSKTLAVFEFILRKLNTSVL